MQKIKISDSIHILQYLIIGVAFSELWFAGQEIGRKINPYIENTYDCTYVLITLLVSFIALIFYIKKDNLAEIKAFINSRRIDLLISFFAGITISYKNHGFGEKIYKEVMYAIDPSIVFLIVAIFLFSLNMNVAKWITVNTIYKLKNIIFPLPKPIFLSDDAIKESQEDLLGTEQQAKFFAESIINGGSRESIIFGIDAPWGAGKTSFINLSIKHLEQITTTKTIIYRFEPLRYDERSDLTQHFISDLANTIASHTYDPKLKNELEKYIKKIKGNKKISFFGVELELSNTESEEPIEETLNNLEEILFSLRFKIVVIIDDLDRLSWEGVRNILFSVKRSFMLNNISYVFCYDTGNIAALSRNIKNPQSIEFFEKFINVKITLFPSVSSLKNYISENLELVLKNNKNRESISNVASTEKIKLTIKHLENIFDSNDHILYKNIIGDIRKIKRIINTIILLDIDKMDHLDGDFCESDLLHLVLIYVNFPNIFRDMYDAETNGKRGLFSVFRFYEGSEYAWKNSERYKSYVSNKNHEEQFILEKLFHPNNQNPSDLDLATKAKFNSVESNNLERYLKLIANRGYTSERDDTFRFIERHKNLVMEGKSINEIFSNEKFSFRKGEETRVKLWVSIKKEPYNIKSSATEIIKTLIDSLPSYSLIRYENLITDSRTSLIIVLMDLLNHAGWGINANDRKDNRPEKISKISEWIFGDNMPKKNSILDLLADERRGMLGIYDLLIFRLYCCADRNNSFYNIQSSLAFHENPSSATSGATTELAKQQMREISQKVFGIFKERYISAGLCIFNDIERLTLNEFLGENIEYIYTCVRENKVTEESLIQSLESHKYLVAAFVIYQLANPLISSGIGCGYYDEEGNSNSAGISKTMNEYLFNVCFNPEKDENLEKFLIYLLTNFSHMFNSYDSVDYAPHIKHFTTHIDELTLKNYWSKNKEKILSLKLEEKKKVIFTRAYTATYKDDLKAVYEMLNQI